MSLKGISVIDAMQSIIDERDKAQERVQELEQQLAALTQPPVKPKPEPKPDPCEDWIALQPHNAYELVVVDAGGGRKLWFPKDTIRTLWPHIEAAIKGGQHVE